MWHHLRKDIVSSCNLRCLLILLYGRSRTYRVTSLCAGWFCITCITCTADCDMWAFVTHEIKSIIFFFFIYSILFREMTTEYIIYLKDGFMVSFPMENRWYTQFFTLLWAKKWTLTFPEAAILNFTQNGWQRSITTCLRWFLKPSHPYLTPCQI